MVRRYLELAEERTEEARKQSHQAVVDIDDLDNLATPEEILLSAVSGEDAQVCCFFIEFNIFVSYITKFGKVPNLFDIKIFCFISKCLRKFVY